MKWNSNGVAADMISAVREAMAELGVLEDADGIKLNIHQDADRLIVDCKNGSATIRCKRKCEVFRGLLLVKQADGRELHIEERPVLESVGLMADNSRNAVLNIPSAKKLIRTLALMGYDMLQLYTEDTYEVDGEPYFGYLRGRFSKNEMKELNAYAASFGIELVPCIQTLAHLNAIMRYKPYWGVNDTADILLAGEERTYELLEHMFKTLAECFTSRNVNIGMDEAHMLGLGKYLDRHGYTNRFDIMITHLNRVMEICKRYGFKPMMWSDMFFRLAFGGQYYVSGGDIPKEVLGAIPEDVTLVYWDYYSENEKQYKDMLASHLRLTQNVRFAGGAWKWMGFAPDNGYSLRASRSALNQVLASGVKSAFVTAWGDNGAECATFSVLPTLLYYAERAYGETGEGEGYENRFRALTGNDMRDFMKLDLPNRVKDRGKKPEGVPNPCKYLLYNDPFCGTLDSNVAEGDGKAYAEGAAELETAEKRGGEWAYLYRTLKELCRVLEVKAELGVKTRKVYRAGDRAALKALAENEYTTLLARLDTFYRAFREQWYLENKPHGFDVQDLRIGGLIQRVASCKERLLQYAAGEIADIPELCEDILDCNGNGSACGVDVSFGLNIWSQNSSVNIV